MTMPRPPASVEAALFAVLQQLAPAAIQAATGKTFGHFSKVSSPARDLALHFRDAAALDAALLVAGQHPRFGAVYRRLVADTLNRLNGTARATGLDLIGTMLRAAQEVGEFAAVTAEAMADGVLSPDEITRLTKIAEANQRVWSNILDDLHHAGAPTAATVVAEGGGE